MQPVSTPPVVYPAQNPLSPSAPDREKAERLERYGSAEFTRQLLEHMHEAKKAAIFGLPGQSDA